MRTFAAFTLCTQVPPTSCRSGQPDHSSSLSDMCMTNQQRPRFPFWRRKWISDMITDAENCPGPDIQWCRLRAILLSPVRSEWREIRGDSMSKWEINSSKLNSVPLNLLCLWFERLHHRSNRSRMPDGMSSFSASLLVHWYFWHCCRCCCWVLWRC